MKRLVLLLAAGIFSHTLLAQGWTEMGPGIASLNANGQIISVVTDKTGKTYVSGGFIMTSAREVYNWTGTHWDVTGSFGGNSWFAAMCTDTANNLYVGGNFTNGSGKYFVAKWDGTAWSQVGSGMNQLNANGKIWAMCSDASGNIYAAGEFTNASGKHYVAKWDGLAWTELGVGGTLLNANNTIYALCADQVGNVYAGGDFLNTSGDHYVARFDAASSSWASAGTFNDIIGAMVCDAAGNVYVGGDFTNASGNTYVAKWDGAFWNELGGLNALGKTGWIAAMSLGRNGNLYVGGGITGATGMFCVEHWDGASWSELGAADGPLNANSSIFTICADTINNRIMTAGNFKNANGKYYVAKYDIPGVAVRDAKATTIKASLYPNPANDVLTIAVSEAWGDNGMIVVNDVTGKQVLRQKVSKKSAGSYTVNITELPAGVYLVDVYADGGHCVEQFVRE